MIPCISSTVNCGFEYSTELLKKKWFPSKVALTRLLFLNLKKETGFPLASSPQVASFSTIAFTEDHEVFTKLSASKAHKSSVIRFSLSPMIQVNKRSFERQRNLKTFL